MRDAAWASSLLVGEAGQGEAGYREGQASRDEGKVPSPADGGRCRYDNTRSD